MHLSPTIKNKLVMNSPVRLTNLLDALPRSKRTLAQRYNVTKRDIKLARLFGRHYYDGTRNQGYGGYSDDGRWIPVAINIAKTLKYSSNNSLCEIGCAKGFLINAFVDQKLVRLAFGLDASLYALKKAQHIQNVYLIHANAINIPFFDKSIDHIISINSLHNFLDRNEIIQALREIQRVAKETAYIRVASYNSIAQKLTIDKWATAGRGYFHITEWLDIFNEAGFTGYYDWWHPDPDVII